MTEDKIEKMLERLSGRDLNKLADSLKTLSGFTKQRELRKILAKKLARFEERVSVLEKITATKKGIEGQDNNNKGGSELWPSLTGE